MRSLCTTAREQPLLTAAGEVNHNLMHSNEDQCSQEERNEIDKSLQKKTLLLKKKNQRVCKVHLGLLMQRKVNSKLDVNPTPTSLMPSICVDTDGKFVLNLMANWELPVLGGYLALTHLQLKCFSSISLDVQHALPTMSGQSAV